MSHAATQIRDQIVAALTGVSGLPTPVVGRPRQLAEATEKLIIEPISETITTDTIHAGPWQARELIINVIAVAATYDAVDAMSLLIEEAISAVECKPQLTERTYERDAETYKDVVGVALAYTALYGVASNDVETLMS